jgi:DNA-directed RNA polymerase specialized sigma24 family protein
MDHEHPCQNGKTPATTADEVLPADEVYRLARLAMAPWRSKALPPSVSREDLEQTAALEILTRAQQAWEAGKQFSARLLVQAASDAIGRECRKGRRGGGDPIPESLSAPSKDAPWTGDIDTLLTRLTPQEREVVSRHYGLDSHPPTPTTAIAAALGLSDSTCHRLLDRAHSKMAAPSTPGVPVAPVSTTGNATSAPFQDGPGDLASCETDAPASDHPSSQVAPGWSDSPRPRTPCGSCGCRSSPPHPRYPKAPKDSEGGFAR